MSGQRPAVPDRWLLLIHQIPPKPDYLRVKVGRRLQRIGAVAVKNSVYALPDSEQSLEDFQWVRAEIVDGGGDASICRAEFVDGLTGDGIRQLFRGARDADFASIATAARERWAAARARPRDASGARPDDELTKLRRRFAAVAAIDYFESAERLAAKEAIEILEAEREPDQAIATSSRAPRMSRADYTGRTWVTRRNVFIDRMASAWLIRRFIDPDARFRFVADDGYRPARGEVRFDMFDGEFTHDGDRCTFEGLVDRFMPNASALRSLGEVIHDIDLKDEKFAREEAAGIERVIAGIARAYADDDERIERSRQLFDELYAAFSHDASAGD